MIDTQAMQNDDGDVWVQAGIVGWRQRADSALADAAEFVARFHVAAAIHRGACALASGMPRQDCTCDPFVVSPGAPLQSWPAQS